MGRCNKSSEDLHLFEMKTFGGSMESVPQLEEVEYEIPKRFT